MRKRIGSGSGYRGGSRIFLGGGALVSCSTSTPINHIVLFFLQNTSCIRKPQVISGRGAHPLHPPPRSAPGQGRIQDFFRRGCTRLLLYFNTNKPHSSFFFLQNTSCIRKPQVISGRGAHPLHPPPRSAPGQGRIQDFFRRGCTRLLLYFNTNKPHSSFFFLQNTSCIRKPQVISGRGAHPLHPPPRSAPGID